LTRFFNSSFASEIFFFSKTEKGWKLNIVISLKFKENQLMRLIDIGYGEFSTTH